jgi:hypothetical protein
MDFSYKLFILFFTLVGLSACGDSSEKTNSLPSANSGIDQTVIERSNITLNGTASDEDGEIASYHWSQISGPMVETSSADFATTTFIAPSVDTEQVMTFELTVTDSEGATASDTVDITITPILFPVNAGKDQTYFYYESFALSCNPNDTDISNLNFLWKQLEGPQLKLSDTTACSQELKLTNYDGVYTFELTVSDQLDTNVSTVNITSKKYSGERYERYELTNNGNTYWRSYNRLPLVDWDSTYSAVRKLNFDTPFISLTSDGRYLYALTNEKLLVLKDNGSEIVEINSYHGEYHQVGFANEHLYLVGSAGLDIINASNPLSLLLIAHFPIYVRNSDPFMVSSQYAYIPSNLDVCEMCGSEGYDEAYFLIDISIPSTPQYAATFSNTISKGTDDNYYYWGNCFLDKATPDRESVWQDEAEPCDQFSDSNYFYEPDTILVNGEAIYTVYERDDRLEGLHVYNVNNRQLTLSQLFIGDFKLLNRDAIFSMDSSNLNFLNLHILNLENPFEPKYFARFKISDELFNMITNDEILYGIDTEGTLTAIDTQPIKINQVTANSAEIEVDKTVVIDYQYTALSEIDGDCSVTSGYCRVEFDKVNNSLSAIWQPTELGEQEMLIYIGNNDYTISARERVIVTAP